MILYPQWTEDRAKIDGYSSKKPPHVSGVIGMFRLKLLNRTARSSLDDSVMFQIQRMAVEEAIERRRRAAAYEKRRNEIRRNIEGAQPFR